MTRIVLQAHARPRILAVDFTQAEINRLRDAGWNTVRGATGLHDGGEFCIPSAFQDVEVLLLRVEEGAFTSAKKPSDASVVKEPAFTALMADVWARGGWTLLFVPTGNPSDLSDLPLAKDLGVMMWKGLPYPLHATLPKGATGPRFPTFLGQTAWLANREPEAEILRPFMGAMRTARILDAKPLEPREYGVPERTWITGDDSGTGCALAVRFQPYGAYRGHHGGLLVLPDFKDNVAVAMALLQGSVVNANPTLFDSPEAPWLDEYLPHPACELEKQRAVFEAEAHARLLNLERQRDAEVERHEWLLRLLVSEGTELVSAAKQALEYLGYAVQDMDTLQPRTKREDLRITAGPSFGLVEVKGTKRGPGEEFITQAIKHANRYARETSGPPPPCVLLVNHSRLLPPDKRPGFYAAEHVQDRLVQNGIAAVDSVALHQACQAVLAGTARPEDVRARMQVPGVVRF